MTLQDVYSTHAFHWQSSNVQFSSHQGHAPALGSEIESWTYSGSDVPPAGAGNARINLWLISGNAPSDGQGVEIAIESFTFVPEG